MYDDLVYLWCLQFEYSIHDEGLRSTERSKETSRQQNEITGEQYLLTFLNIQWICFPYIRWGIYRNDLTIRRWNSEQKICYGHYVFICFICLICSYVPKVKNCYIYVIIWFHNWLKPFDILWCVIYEMTMDKNTCICDMCIDLWFSQVMDEHRTCI